MCRAMVWQSDGVIWVPGEVLVAVRDRLGLRGRWDSGWLFERAELDGERVLVILRFEDERRFGVHYELADVPNGPNSGELCETPQDWADEIVLDIDEQVLTGGVGRAERAAGPDGLEVLRWVS